MEPNKDFLDMGLRFWADIKLISEQAGYSKDGKIIFHEADKIKEIYEKEGVRVDHILNSEGVSDYGRLLITYLKYRANILNSQSRYSLMDKDTAENEFNKLVRKKTSRKCPLPGNKQRGEKAGFAYFTCIINMLIEDNIGDYPCDYDPKRLTYFLTDDYPSQVLSRRVDGAFPTVKDPIAIWEIKEYYNTTTFGSRVADGVYETLLDGMELEELHEATGKKVYHYFMVDDYLTWWKMGKSYLCKMVDMMHMGYVDEILFGREVLDRLPKLARMWVKELSK